MLKLEEIVSIRVLCSSLFLTYHSGPPRDDPISEEATWEQRSEDGVFLHPRPVKRIFRVLGWLWDEDDAVFVGLEVARLLRSFIIAANGVLFDNVFTMVQLVVDTRDNGFVLFCNLCHDQGDEGEMW